MTGLFSVVSPKSCNEPAIYEGKSLKLETPFFPESDSSSTPSESDSCSSRTERSTATAPPQFQMPSSAAKRLSLGFALSTRTHHYGSFYLRMGAVGKLHNHIYRFIGTRCNCWDTVYIIPGKSLLKVLHCRCLINLMWLIRVVSQQCIAT